MAFKKIDILVYFSVWVKINNQGVAGIYHAQIVISFYLVFLGIIFIFYGLFGGGYGMLKVLYIAYIIIIIII